MAMKGLIRIKSSAPLYKNRFAQKSSVPLKKYTLIEKKIILKKIVSWHHSHLAYFTPEVSTYAHAKFGNDGASGLAVHKG